MSLLRFVRSFWSVFFGEGWYGLLDATTFSMTSEPGEETEGET
ncbi:MAG TPA: hypothetical protein VIO16_03440 [Dehalococcoidia bacterium]|jgi:hypothetical protein